MSAPDQPAANAPEYRDSVRLVAAEVRIAELEANLEKVRRYSTDTLKRAEQAEAENERLRGIIHGKHPDPDSPEWYPWVNTVIGRCPYHGVELTRGSWHMHLHCPREKY